MRKPSRKTVLILLLIMAIATAGATTYLLVFSKKTDKATPTVTQPEEVKKEVVAPATPEAPKKEEEQSRFVLLVKVVVLAVIVVLIISIITKRRRPYHGASTSHGDHGKQPLSFFEWTLSIGTIVVIVAGVLFGVWVVPKIYEWFTKEKPATPATVLGVQGTKEVLIPFCEGVTPCPLEIPEGRFKIRTDGDPFRVKFKGVDHWVEYDGKGDFHAPDGVEPGEAQFASSDQKNPHVRMQVFRKVIVSSK